jgi:formylmethanofuran dehydrogenase subunit E
LAYQRIPEVELLVLQEVQMEISLAEILGRDGYRVNCAYCGEEIINQREVIIDGESWCRGCAGQNYYSLQSTSVPFYNTRRQFCRSISNVG